MKKNVLKKIAAVTLCATAMLTMNNTGVFAADANLTTEEKSKEMEEWMEQYKDEYEAHKKLSDYEKIQLIADNPEKMEYNGWDRVFEEDGCIYCMQGDMLMWMATKEEKVSEIVIPEDVKRVFHDSFLGVEFKDDARIVLPEGISEITFMTFCCVDDIKEISISEKNENYCTVDGVLFTKDMKTLIAYPNMKEDDSYIIPDTVENINSLAFHLNNNLKRIQIGSNVTNIDSRNLADCTYSVFNSSLEIYIPDNDALKNVISQYSECKVISDTIENARALVNNLINGGDLNGDNKVTLADAQLALKVALNIVKLPDIGMKVAATSEEKTITISDAKTILELALGIR